MADPQGYDRLLATLRSVEEQLQLLGRTESAAAVQYAIDFYGGSAAEFLGESRIALRAVLAKEKGLPDTLVALMKRTIDDITEGFRSVGGE